MMSINSVLLNLSVSIIEAIHVAHSLRPVPEQQADALPVVSPSDALRDRRTCIDLDKLAAVMP